MQGLGEWTSYRHSWRDRLKKRNNRINHRNLQILGQGWLNWEASRQKRAATRLCIHDFVCFNHMHWWSVLWPRLEHDWCCSALLLEWLGWHHCCWNRPHRLHHNDWRVDWRPRQWHRLWSFREKTHHNECRIHLLNWLLHHGYLTIDKLPVAGPLHHRSKHWVHPPNRPPLPVRDGSGRDSRSASCYLCHDEYHQSVLFYDTWPYPIAPLALDVRLDCFLISCLLDLLVLHARVA